MMKNFNILGVQGKIRVLGVRGGGGGGGGHEKPICKGESPKKGAWTIWRFKGGLCKKEEGDVFEGLLMHTMTSDEFVFRQCLVWLVLHNFVETKG